MEYEKHAVNDINSFAEKGTCVKTIQIFPIFLWQSYQENFNIS